MSVLNGHYSNIQQLRKWMQLSCSQRKGLATQSGRCGGDKCEQWNECGSGDVSLGSDSLLKSKVDRQVIV